MPGNSVPNQEIEQFLGHVEDEQKIKRAVLKMNGIETRYYAQDRQQQQTHDVYQMACEAIADCLGRRSVLPAPVSFLAAGTTYAPLGGPGMGSLLHDQLGKRGLLQRPVEISSHAGICTSAAAGLVAACRAVAAGEHAAAISVGSEHPSSALKAAAFRVVDDRSEHTELRRSQWFMSVFLRFMLSDGAGAFLLESAPKESGVSLRVNWTESKSFAHQTPLCMRTRKPRSAAVTGRGCALEVPDSYGERVLSGSHATTPRRPRRLRHGVATPVFLLFPSEDDRHHARAFELRSHCSLLDQS